MKKNSIKENCVILCTDEITFKEYNVENNKLNKNNYDELNIKLKKFDLYSTLSETYNIRSAEQINEEFNEYINDNENISGILISLKNDVYYEDIVENIRNKYDVPIIVQLNRPDMNVETSLYNMGADLVDNIYQSTFIMAVKLRKIVRIFNCLPDIAENSDVDSEVIESAKYVKIKNISLKGKARKYGSLMVFDKVKEVYLDENLVTLTPKEYKCLLLLISSPGNVVLKETFIKHIWEERSEDPSKSVRVVDSHIKDIRKKIAGYDVKIASRYGVGYMLVKNEK